MECHCASVNESMDLRSWNLYGNIPPEGGYGHTMEPKIYSTGSNREWRNLSISENINIDSYLLIRKSCDFMILLNLRISMCSE